jgi:hypothetical protein
MASMTVLSPLEVAIEAKGLAAVARHVEVTHQAVRKWTRRGRMPRTEWTGETRYAEKIEELMQGAVTKEQLLAPWPATHAANGEEARDAA